MTDATERESTSRFAFPPDLLGAGPELAELFARNTHDGIAIVDGATVVW
jgi:hypothetical protein